MSESYAEYRKAVKREWFRRKYRERAFAKAEAERKRKWLESEEAQQLNREASLRYKRSLRPISFDERTELDKFAALLKKLSERGVDYKLRRENGRLYVLMRVTSKTPSREVCRSS